MTTKANIREVYFERVFNLGNCESFRLGLHATAGAGQTAESVIAELDAFTLEMRKKQRKRNGRRCSVNDMD
jgi:hypothetical protein